MVLESIQGKGKILVEGLKEFVSYEERLSTHMSSLEKRRLRSDLFIPCKFLRKGNRERCWYLLPWELISGCVGVAQRTRGGSG